MGKPAICCRNCPQAKWFTEHRGIPFSSMNIAIEMCAQTEESKPE